jgi:midasin (ATPase involved in ribosome maturation)
MLQRAQEASPTPPTLSSTTEPVVTTEGQQQPPIPKLRSGRFISIRDVTKWCSRVEDAVKGSDFNNGLVSSQVREVAFLEAVDCFCCAIAKGPLRRQVVDLIAKIWQIETSRVEYFITSYKPQLNVTKSTVNLGRVVQLPIYNSDNSSTQTLQLEGDNYCYTRHSLVLMERLAQCLK